MERAGDVLSDLEERLVTANDVCHHAEAERAEIVAAIQAVKKARESLGSLQGATSAAILGVSMQGSIADRAVAAVKRAAGPVHTNDVVKALGLGKGGYNNVFSALRRRPEVESAGRGKWKAKG